MLFRGNRVSILRFAFEAGLSIATATVYDEGDVIDADATRERLELGRLPNSSLAALITQQRFPLSVLSTFIRGSSATVYAEVFEA